MSNGTFCRKSFKKFSAANTSKCVCMWEKIKDFLNMHVCGFCWISIAAILFSFIIINITYSTIYFTSTALTVHWKMLFCVLWQQFIQDLNCFPLAMMFFCVWRVRSAKSFKLNWHKVFDCVNSWTLCLSYHLVRDGFFSLCKIIMKLDEEEVIQWFICTSEQWMLSIIWQMTCILWCKIEANLTCWETP